MIRSELLSAFRTRLAEVDSIEEWPIQYANRRGEVDLNVVQQYLEETPFATNSDDSSVGYAVRWRELVGTWQVMVCVPAGVDMFTALDFADTLERHFLAVPSMTLADGSAIRISNVLIGTPRPARADDPWVRVPVVFTYAATTHT